MKKFRWKYWSRELHYWLAALCALPILIVIGSGLLLQLKKQLDWVQPPSQHGTGKEPTLNYDDLLKAVQQVPHAGIQTWEDIDRLDIRPKKGLIKVRGKNRWEIQLDQQTGAILQTAYRRSDLIESIHDGSFFHQKIKLWIFLPSAIILLILWISGIILFLYPIQARTRKWTRTISKKWNKKTPPKPSMLRTNQAKKHPFLGSILKEQKTHHKTPF